MNKISIICTTYNHEPYIRQTLQGFVTQQCNFSFEIVIHDDASTDRTAEIIREYEAEYPQLFRTILQTENQYSKGINIWKNLFTDPTCAEYIAICEGDDYWIDPLKLQKQVDFLEEHEEYGMVYTKAQQYIDTTGEFSNIIGFKINSFEQLLMSNSIPTLTTVLRNSIYKKYDKDIDPSMRNWKMGDYPLWLYIFAKTKIHFINQVTAIYRVLDNSASHPQDGKKMLDFSRSVQDIRAFFAARYSPELVELVKESGIRIMFEAACRARDRKMQEELRIQAKKYNSNKMLFLNIVGLFPQLYIEIIDKYRKL